MARVTLQVRRNEHDERQRVPDDADQHDERDEVQLEVDEEVAKEDDIHVVGEPRWRVHPVANVAVIE